MVYTAMYVLQKISTEVTGISDKLLLYEVQVPDIHFVEGCGAELSMPVENFDGEHFDKAAFGLQGFFGIGNHLIADGDGVEQVGSSRLEVLDLCTFKPYGNLKALVLHDLPEQQGVEGIGGREDRSSKNGIP